MERNKWDEHPLKEVKS